MQTPVNFFQPLLVFQVYDQSLPFCEARKMPFKSSPVASISAPITIFFVIVLNNRRQDVLGVSFTNLRHYQRGGHP